MLSLSTYPNDDSFNSCTMRRLLSLRYSLIRYDFHMRKSDDAHMRWILRKIANLTVEMFFNRYGLRQTVCPEFYNGFFGGK